MTTTLEVRPEARDLSPLPDGCVLTTADLALLIDVPEKTIEWWRRERNGPTPMHVGRHVRYRSEDVKKWLADLAEAGERWMVS